MKDKSDRLSEGERTAAIQSAATGLESKSLNDPPARKRARLAKPNRNEGMLT